MPENTNPEPAENESEDIEVVAHTGDEEEEGADICVTNFSENLR